MKMFVRAALALIVSLSLAGAADAQGAKKGADPKNAPAQKEPMPPQPQQIALTEQQVQNFIKVTPDVNKATEGLQTEPDAKMMAQLEDLAKKGGFASLEEYQIVTANIGAVMQGIDPKTKKFGDPKAMMQAQIKQVQADKSMKPAEKKEAVAELNQAIKDIQPIQNKGNIALVENNYDKIAALMQGN